MTDFLKLNVFSTDKEIVRQVRVTKSGKESLQALHLRVYYLVYKEAKR